MTASTPAHRSDGEQLKLEEALRDLFEHKIRFNELLGVKVESLNPSSPRLRFDMRPELIGSHLYGRLHGGVISATLDAMGGFALMIAIAEKHGDESAEQIMNRFSRMGTIDLRIDFLRQGIGRCFYASAVVSRLGGRVGSVQMRLENESGLLIATGAAAYMIS